MPECLTDKIVTTRKPHRCWGCAREFPVGSNLRLLESVDAGVFYRSYWCPVCDAVWNAGDYVADDGIAFGDLKREDDAWEETRARLEGKEASDA